MATLFLVSVFVVATCGLVYELIAGALASYLLGDSVTQFSTIIGVYLFAMGIGSYLSKYIHKNLVSVFVRVELLIGLIGGFSATLLFCAFEFVFSFRLILYSMVGIIGTLVGIEIPLMMRILKDRFEFKDLVSKVFTFDYIGALLGSLLFPLVLVPHLGLIRTAFLFGLFNAGVALWTLVLFGEKIKLEKTLKTFSIVIILLLTLGFAFADKITSWSENNQYADSIIYSASSPYQRIVLTRSSHDLKLYLNGNLQFSSRDEYRYHEALVHTGLSLIPHPKNILVLGGGDGMAVREILKYPSVEHITLVDLDPEVLGLFSKNEILLNLNEHSLLSPKVTVVNQDAFIWVRDNRDLFDFIVVDFPDPGNFSVGKLYSNVFYRALKERLADQGILTVQSTSPFFAKKSFWCINHTLQSVGLLTIPYHAYIPSFGEWGYVMASHQAMDGPRNFPAGLKFIRNETLPALFDFPEDMKAQDIEVNKLNNQILVRYFDEEWSAYAQ